MPADSNPTGSNPADVGRSLELLWSTGERSAPGPKPGLSIAKIVQAAIEVADAEGLEALSMQRVAGELGYTTMSLYRYVPGKAQLIEVMADTACGQPPDPAAMTDGGWRAEVERWVDALWEVYREHPWLVRVQIRTPPLGPNGLAWLESLLTALRRIGLPLDEMFALAMFLSSAVRDLARFATDLVPMGAGYDQVLEKIPDRSRFPTLTALLSAPSAGNEAMAEDESNEVGPVVEFGLQRLLDGIDAYVQVRHREGGGA